MAFRQGEDIVIWIINFVNDINSYEFELFDNTFTGPVLFRQWEENSFSQGTAEIVTDNRFAVDFSGGSITYIRIEDVYDPEEMHAREWQVINADIGLRYTELENKLEGNALIAIDKELDNVNLEIETTFFEFEQGQWQQLISRIIKVKKDLQLGEEARTIFFNVKNLPEVNGLIRVDTDINIVKEGVLLKRKSFSNLFH